MALKREALEFMKELMGEDDQSNLKDLSQYEMLLLDDKPIKQITDEDKKFLLEFPELLHISLNACQLTSLQNFPPLTTLFKLELNDNKFPADQLKHLKELTNLENLKLANTKISTLQELSALKALPLKFLDLGGCPVSEIDGYRDKVYAMFPVLEVLDSIDKNGEEAFSESELELIDEDELDEMDEEELKKKIASGEIEILEDSDDDEDEEDDEEDNGNEKEGEKKKAGKEEAEIEQAKEPQKKTKQ